MPQFVGVSGSWKRIIGKWVGVGNSWKRVTSEYVGVSGAWKSISVDKVTLSGETVVALGIATIIFNTDGTVDKTEDATTVQVDASTDWIIPNSGAAGHTYYIRATKTSGDDPNIGDDLATWLALSSKRQWGQSSTLETLTCTLKIEIARDSGGSDVLASGTYTLGVGQP